MRISHSFRRSLGRAKITFVTCFSYRPSFLSSGLSAKCFKLNNIKQWYSELHGNKGDQFIFLKIVYHFPLESNRKSVDGLCTSKAPCIIFAYQSSSINVFASVVPISKFFLSNLPSLHSQWIILAYAMAMITKTFACSMIKIHHD